VLFGTVFWSKFAHMFFKPAAAFQKKIIMADGSRENLPDEYDLTDPAPATRTETDSRSTKSLRMILKGQGVT